MFDITRTDLPDGVYLSSVMPEELYFVQERIGSTDLVRLSKPSCEDWWYGSRYNLRVKREDPSEEQIFGKALHVYVLEGEPAFRRQFVRSDFDDYSKAGAKAEKAKLAPGVQRLKPDSWADIYQMGELILNYQDKYRDPTQRLDLKALMQGGISELTVLFTFMGIRMRARFDKFLTHFTVDLKTFGNHKQQIYDDDTLIDIVVQMRYETQRFIYDIARDALCDMVRRHNAGEDVLVHGATPGQMKFLTKAASVDRWKWCWIFYKKVNHSARNPSAPIISPLTRPAYDATYDRGQAYVENAVANYRGLMERFGPKVPWARINREMQPDDQKFIDRYLRPKSQQFEIAPEDEPDDT